MANSRPNVNNLFRGLLADRGIAVQDFTGQIHSLNYKYPLYVRPGGVTGVVMHNTSGLIMLPNLVNTWKQKEPYPPPSHLAISRTGDVGLYVKLDYADRATENTNKHLSIEFVAVENGDVTSEQIDTAAVILAFANVVYGMELVVANGRSAPGLAHHALFVDAGNPRGHFNCPGLTIIGRKDVILEKARTIAAALSFDDKDEPAGRWEVEVDRWRWIYTFDPNGSVSWRDPFNGMTGKGTWKVSGGNVVFTWLNSKTTESWQLPLKSQGQEGTTTMKGITYAVKATRLH